MNKVNGKRDLPIFFLHPRRSAKTPVPPLRFAAEHGACRVPMRFLGGDLQFGPLDFTRELDDIGLQFRNRHGVQIQRHNFFLRRLQVIAVDRHGRFPSVRHHFLNRGSRRLSLRIPLWEVGRNSPRACSSAACYMVEPNRNPIGAIMHPGME